MDSSLKKYDKANTEQATGRPRLSVVLGLVVSGISLAGLISIWLRFNLDSPSKGVVFLVTQINLDAEKNLATWVATLFLAGNAVLLSLCAVTARDRGESHVRAWWGLSLVFFILSLDEFVSLHEAVGRVVHAALDLQGLPSFGWLVPALIIVPLLFWSFLGFLRGLPQTTRRRFLFAGFVYVLGAFGLELVGALYLGDASTWNPIYSLITWVEESLELVGQALFMIALATHLDVRQRLLGQGM